VRERSASQTETTSEAQGTPSETDAPVSASVRAPDLTEPAIDASLRAIRQWSAPGESRLAMTYVIRSRPEKPSLISRAMQVVVSSVGEPWKWGWDPGALPEYLAERDFRLVRDVPMAEAAQ